MTVTTKKNVVLGFLGTQLDGGFSSKRWERWRPTVSLCGDPDFPIHRVDLFLNKAEHVPLAQLIADDIGRVSPHTEVQAHVLDIPKAWDFASTYAALFDFARTYEYADDCDYFVHLTTGTHTAQICLFKLTESRHFPAKLIDTHLDKGADEPWRGTRDIIDLNLAAYDLLTSRFVQEQADSETLLKSGIATRNPAFNNTIRQIEKVAMRSSAPILITGPTGAGKSQLAKRIFELRARRHLVSGPFVEVNCATLSGDKAMSTLFGHKKGAFTGANEGRPGLLKTADKGILFLDEIGLLGLEEQAMLLRALEEKRFMPLGCDTDVGSDFQLITGTNLDLAEEVAAGRFRADLYARLNVWTFCLPSLAQRPEDIAPNIDHELQQASVAVKSRIVFGAGARDRYLAFAQTAPWPGNFRDLAASVMRMATLAEGGRITVADVDDEIARLQSIWPRGAQCPLPATSAPQATSPASGDSPALSLVERIKPGVELDQFEAVQLDAVLRAIRDTDSMAEAYRKLFAVSRASRKTVNDTHRIRTLLASWDLDYKKVKVQLAAA